MVLDELGFYRCLNCGTMIVYDVTDTEKYKHFIMQFIKEISSKERINELSCSPEGLASCAR